MAGVRARVRRVLVTLGGAVLAASGLVAVTPGPAGAAEWWETSSSAGWYDGQVSYSQVLNCFSVIQGSPYYEAGVGAYVGYLADPQNARPAAGDKGWIRYRVYGMGNPCTGGSYFRPKFYLPAGMAWDASRQIACGYDGSGGSAPQANCPGWSNMDASNAYWNNGSGSGGNLWGVAQGHYWEFQFPVTMSQPLSGAILDAHLDVADGNSNPQMLLRSNNIYVFNASAQDPAAVMYDQPSSYDAAVLPWDPTAPTQYGMLSAFQAVVDGRSGTAYVQISTDPSFTSILGSDQVPFGTGWQSIDVKTDWGAPIPALSPGTTYYWRGVVVPTGQLAVVGATQSFVLKAGGGVVQSTVGGASGGGVGTGSGGTLGGTITPTPVPAPAPTPAPTPAPAPAPAPTPAPTASATVTSPAKAGKGVKVTLTCSGACQGKVTVTVSKKVAKKLGVRSRTLGTAKASLTVAGTKVVTVTLSRAVRTRLAKLGKITASVKVTTSVGGTTSSTTKKVVIKG